MITANLQTRGGWMAGVEFPDYEDPDLLWKDLREDPDKVRIQRSQGPRGVRLRTYVGEVTALEVHGMTPIVPQHAPGRAEEIKKAQESEWNALEQDEGEGVDDTTEPN